MDKWKIATICLIIVCLILITQIISNRLNYDFGKIKISRNQFNTIMKELGDEYKEIIICDLEGDKCIQIWGFE